MSRRGVNKVIIVGNLGHDPELRMTANNEAVANFSVATSDVWRDKQTGQQQERTEWHRVVAFGPLADIVARFAQAGTKVYCEGALRTKKWTDQQGVERYATQIRLNEFEVLKDGRQADQAPQQSAPQGHQQAPNQAPPQQSARGAYFQNERRGGPPPDARRNPNGTQVSPYAVPEDYYGPQSDDIPWE